MIRLEPRAIIISKLVKNLFPKKSENISEVDLKTAIQQFAMHVGMKKVQTTEGFFNLIKSASEQIDDLPILVLFLDEIDTIMQACINNKEQAEDLAEQFKCNFLGNIISYAHSRKDI